MSQFNLNNPNTLYLQQLPGHFIKRAIRASFIDEPIWRMKDTLPVIDAIEKMGFAMTNVYVYGLIDGIPKVPSHAVYDFEIEEFPLDDSWHKIVRKSSIAAVKFIKRFQFLASDSFHGQEAAFSFWAFNEAVYRRFQMSGLKSDEKVTNF
jgi:hypothetical protein